MMMMNLIIWFRPLFDPHMRHQFTFVDVNMLAKMYASFKMCLTTDIQFHFPCLLAIFGRFPNTEATQTRELLVSNRLCSKINEMLRCCRLCQVCKKTVDRRRTFYASTSSHQIQILVVSNQNAYFQWFFQIVDVMWSIDKKTSNEKEPN